MRTFAYGLKETVAAVVLSCFIAGGVGAVTSPAATERDDSIANSVDRTHKGDRLSHRQPSTSSSTQMAPATPKRAPLGCDPAFSPVVEPALAHIFKRCMV